MIKTLPFLLLLTVSPSFSQWLLPINFFRETNDEGDLDSTNLKTQDLISEKDENIEKKMDLELNKFYAKDKVFCEESFQKYENLVKTLDNYIQRYINLFLIASDLQNYKINDLKETIAVDLELSLSGEDLAYLQEYSKTGKQSTHSRNLFKLDAILSKVARQKERSNFEKGIRYSFSFLTSFLYSALNNLSVNNFSPFLIILLVTCLSYNLFFYKPIVWGALINSLIIWDSFNLYWKKLKEIDTEIYVKAKQFNNIPEDCYPENYKWYHSMFEFIFPNRCLQYHQYLNKNPVEEVSLLKCIIDTYAFYVVQTPIKIFGASIKDFCGEISDLWPWPIKYFINIPLAPFFVVVTLFFILILFGKRLRLSFLGASVELGDRNPLPEKAKLKIDSGSQSLREVRKLRPWTKTRFHRRLDRDFGNRRRLFLKSSKSISEMPVNNALGGCDQEMSITPMNG